VAVDRKAIATRNSADRESLFPARHLQVPHFVVRAAGQVLRTDLTRRPDYPGRLHAIASRRGDEQMMDATDVLVEAADLDQTIARWAERIVRDGCFDLTDVGEGHLALSLLEQCLSLAEDLVEPELL
jgi:hypothetical protein